MKRLLLVAAGAVLIFSITTHAARAARAARAVTTPTGYVFLDRTTIGLTPAGFGVWVNHTAPYHSTMARNAAVAVNELRRLGVHIRYRGYGLRPVRDGVIQLHEATKGCGIHHITVAETWTYNAPMPGGKTYVSHADVYFCPRLFRLAAWAIRATVAHELGHALGLGHYSQRYHGSYQLMHPLVHSNILTYQAGDRRGLTRLVRGMGALPRSTSPVDSAASWHYALRYNYLSGDLTTRNVFLHRSGIYVFHYKFYTVVKLTCRAGGWLTVDYDSIDRSVWWAQPRWHLRARDTVYWSKFSSIGQWIQMTMNSQGCRWYVRIYAWVYR